MFNKYPRLTGILIGLTVTVLCAVFFQRSEIGRLLELKTLDYRFRWSSLAPDPRIVHVDIDDGSLARVGRWPWPRHKTAELIRIMHELGASCIAVDLLIDDPQDQSLDDPRLSRDIDLEPNLRIEGDVDLSRIIYDDLEFAEALRAAGNVIIAMHMGTAGPREHDLLQDRIRAEQEKDPDVTAPQIIERLSLGASADDEGLISKALLRERIRPLLLQQFDLTAEQIATRIGMALEDVSRVFAGVKTLAARELVQYLFQVGPVPTVSDTCSAILGDRARTRNTDRVDIRDAFRRELAKEALLGRLPAYRPGDGIPDPRSVLQRALTCDPPWYRFVESAADVGAVNFNADIDGSVRRVPLLVEFEGRLIKHMGLAVACRVLGVRDDQIRVTDDRVVTFPDPTGGPPYELPLDGEGQMLINWTRDASDWKLDRDMKHISAAALWAVADERNMIRDNEIAVSLRYAEIVEAMKGKGRDKDYRKSVSRKNELERRLHLARLKQNVSEATAAAWESELAARKKSIEEENKLQASALELMCDQIREQETPAEQAVDDEAITALNLERVLKVEIPSRRAASARLQKTIEKEKAKLSSNIKGKFVFLGYAATALGDIVPTPIDPHTNGVMCHAHLLNTILQRRPIRPPSAPVNLFLALALGALVAAVTATGGPRMTFLLTLALIFLFVYIAIRVFIEEQLWIVMAGVIVTILITWSLVTLFRQLTAERERRFFSKQLGQYTSPAIAARIAEDPSAVAAFQSVQSREITCIFTDLAGFTTISEEEDAETVQYVLNTYLKRMSQVIWARRGLINKFMGDGIMAFFNASVDPQTEHARNACEVTLDAMAAVEQLKAEHTLGLGAPIFARLQMRAGLATGICKNGDFGSELKTDYTIIGDTVNLAARLEPANKVFGTRVLVNEPLRNAVADAFEFRYLADLQVKGKARVAPVYEMVCRKGELTDDERDYIERFEKGVGLYRRRLWDECIVHFTRMLSRRPDDAGASRYIDACLEFKSFPPDENWVGALELKEK